MAVEPSGELSERTFRTCAVLMLAGLVILAYANTLTNDFVWDDASSVLIHKHVQDPSKFSQLFKEDQHAFGRGQGSFYRPLISASFMLDFALSRSTIAPTSRWGSPDIPDISPVLFHITNLSWHGAATIVLFCLLSQLAAPRWIRVFVPLIFALHPLQTEAVTYISGRGDPMSAAFVLAALCFGLWEKSPGHRIIGTILSAACFAAALLCKESAFIAPALMLLIGLMRPVNRETAPVSRTYLRRLVPVGAQVIVLGGYAWLRFHVLRLQSESVTLPKTFGQLLVETGQAFAGYIRLFFAPTNLHMERTLEGAPGWAGILGFLLLAGCLAALVICLAKRQRRAALGMGWFLLTWLPISGLFPLNAPMAEHWMYLPLAGFFWACAEWLMFATRKPLLCNTLTVIIAVFCVMLLGSTLSRNRDWRDNESIFRATLEQNPRTMRVHYNLAVTYDTMLHNPAGARRHYEQVVALGGNVAQDAAVVSDEVLESRYDKATDHFGALLRLKPTQQLAPIQSEAAFGMGKCLFAMGNIEQAAKLFGQVLQVRPDLKPEIESLMSGGI